MGRAVAWVCSDVWNRSGIVCVEYVHVIVVLRETAASRPQYYAGCWRIMTLCETTASNLLLLEFRFRGV